jgi:hypothetical protein
VFLAWFNEAANGFVAGTAPFASAGTPCSYLPALTIRAKDKNPTGSFLDVRVSVP